MIACLMLDVDGVLVTGRPSDGGVWYEYLQEDLGIDPHWLRSTFFAPYWIDIVEGRADLLTRLQACLDLLPDKFHAQALVNYWFENDSRMDHYVLRDCAKLRAQGVVIYLATNQEHCRAHYLMNEMGLAAHVDGIIYSAQLGCTKPKATFYEAAAKKVGFLPQNIMLIDDNLLNVEGAKDAGWGASHWTSTTTCYELLLAHSRLEPLSIPPIKPC